MNKIVWLHQIQSVAAVDELPDNTVVSIGNASPQSWLDCNQDKRPVMDALLARSPLGWEHVQMDGPSRWDLLVTKRTREEVLDARARAQGYVSHHELEAALTKKGW